MTVANRAAQILRGIRSPMRARTLAGRLSPGKGPAEMLDIDDVIGFVGLDVLFTDSGSIDFTYDAGTNKWTADTLDGVTLAGSLDYLTISSQVITLNPIDLDADVSGTLPIASGGTGAAGASGARDNLGLGTAAVEDIGTSGANVPLLDGANTYSGVSTYSANMNINATLTIVDASSFAIHISQSAVNNVAKFGGIVCLERINANGECLGFLMRTDTSNNIIDYGGSSGTYTSATILRFWTAASVGTTVGTERLRINSTLMDVKGIDLTVGGGAITCGAPTGGVKGTGDINAQAVYDDNVLLTCYPLEAYLDGVIDVGAWDARVLNRLHAETRKTINVLRADYQMMDVEVVDQPAREEVRTHGPAAAFAEDAERRLDPKLFFEDMVERRALPGMPTKDEWAEHGPRSVGKTVQTIWEVVETQSIHIKKLLDRIELLEKGN